MNQNEDLLTRLLSVTERLIYSNGINSTGIDAIVRESGVARKSIYSKFSTKEELVAEVLRRRDERWMSWFIAATSKNDSPRARLLSTFDALNDWFSSSDFNGCAFINAAGEVGRSSMPIAEVANKHKRNLKHYLKDLAKDYGAREPDQMASDFLILIDGAITLAKVMNDKDAAMKAKNLAQRLLDAH